MVGFNQTFVSQTFHRIALVRMATHQQNQLNATVADMDEKYCLYETSLQKFGYRGYDQRKFQTHALNLIPINMHTWPSTKAVSGR